MMKMNSQKLIIITSALLMQIHSIEFWMSQVGAIGFAWSITLEIVMLWLWWRGIWPLALIASALLIAFPMHEITQESIKTLTTHHQAQEANQADLAEVQLLRQSIATYERNSEKRPGWLPKINRIQQRINAAVDRVSDRKTKNATLRFFGISIKEAIAAVQALTLLIIMIAQAIAISDLRKIAAKKRKTLENNSLDIEKDSDFPPAPINLQPYRGAKTEMIETQNAKSAPAGSAKPATHPGYTEAQQKALRLIDQIPAAIRSETKDKGVSQGTWCDGHGINQKHLSLAKNHRRQLEQRKEVAPAAALEQILTALNITNQGAAN